MKVEIFCLCDFASSDSGGKLNVIGVFDTIYANQAPIAQQLCALAVKLRFDKVEEGTKKLRITITDIDGKPVLPSMETPFPVQGTLGNPTSTAQIVSIFSILPLPNFGEYSIDLAIDGRQEASTPLYVRQAPLIPPHLQQPTRP